LVDEGAQQRERVRAQHARADVGEHALDQLLRPRRVACVEVIVRGSYPQRGIGRAQPHG
jgi:hypothetical protein